MAGQGKKRQPFARAGALVEAWRRFCAAIVEDGYVAVPTVTAFIRYVARETGTEETAVAAAVERYLPQVRETVEAIRGDVLSQGSLLGKYQSTMAALAVKNWCRWTDKPDAARGVSAADIAAAAAEIERLIADGG